MKVQCSSCHTTYTLKQVPSKPTTATCKKCGEKFVVGATVASPENSIAIASPEPIPPRTFEVRCIEDIAKLPWTTESEEDFKAMVADCKAFKRSLPWLSKERAQAVSALAKGEVIFRQGAVERARANVRALNPLRKHEKKKSEVAMNSIQISDTSTMEEETDEIVCPNCGSRQIITNKKRFGRGKAAAGGILFGPVGLLGGFIGSGKLILTCLKCGKTWEPGKAN